MGTYGRFMNKAPKNVFEQQPVKTRPHDPITTILPYLLSAFSYSRYICFYYPRPTNCLIFSFRNRTIVVNSFFKETSKPAYHEETL